MNYLSWIFVHQLLSDFIHFSIFCFPISVSMEKYANDAFDSMETDDCLFLLTQLIKSNTFWAAHCFGGELKRPSLNERSFQSQSLLLCLRQCWDGCFSILYFPDYLLTPLQLLLHSPPSKQAFLRIISPLSTSKEVRYGSEPCKLQNPGTISSISSFTSTFTVNIKLSSL